MLSCKRLFAWVVILITIGIHAHICYGLAESTGPDGSNAKAVHQLKGQTGEGTNIGIISAGTVRATHEAFTDSQSQPHAFVYDIGAGIGLASHDTWMAGIAASRGGAVYPDDIGVAPGADIHSVRIVDGQGYVYLSYLTSAMDKLIIDEGCDAIMTGVAFSGDSNGQDILTLIYDYYASHYDTVFALAAGNSGGILIVGDAFNGITTAGLVTTAPDVYRKIGTASSVGPTYDGRRKPEVAGPSYDQTMPSGSSDTNWYTWLSTGGETSFSTPHTAGVAALLKGLAANTSEPDDGHSEVIKAVIVNSTYPNIQDASGQETNPANPANVWHGQRGYGRLDALNAYETLEADKIALGITVTAQKGWAYNTIGSGQEHVYAINGSRHDRLVLTVTWHRLVTRNIHGVYFDEPAPYFNLDMTVSLPGQILYEETDGLNNLEKVDLILPEDGLYEIHLSNPTTKDNRAYGLAFELRPALSADISLNYIVDTEDMTELTNQWLMSGPDLISDIFQDQHIDLFDFLLMQQQWLDYDARYYSN